MPAGTLRWPLFAHALICSALLCCPGAARVLAALFGYRDEGAAGDTTPAASSAGAPAAAAAAAAAAEEGEPVGAEEEEEEELSPGGAGSGAGEAGAADGGQGQQPMELEGGAQAEPGPSSAGRAASASGEGPAAAEAATGVHGTGRATGPDSGSLPAAAEAGHPSPSSGGLAPGRLAQPLRRLNWSELRALPDPVELTLLGPSVGQQGQQGQQAGAPAAWILSFQSAGKDGFMLKVRPAGGGKREGRRGDALGSTHLLPNLHQISTGGWALIAGL